MLWQYRSILFEFTRDGLLSDRYVDDEEIEKALNQLGRQSWELINVSLLQDGLLAFLKRPLQDEPEVAVVSTHNERRELLAKQRPAEPVIPASTPPMLQENRPPIAGRTPIRNELVQVQAEEQAPRRSFDRPSRNRKEQDDDFVGGIRIS